ncbi:MAG TPA: hypothetical protein DCL38_00665 [Lachnospiraceae bacterium]|nr:hypothetical protein [Lachnospiraceae bacterium]
MKDTKKLSAVILITGFILFVLLIGAKSYLKVMDFYINDLPDTIEWTSELGSRFESDFAASFFMKPEFINLNGLMRNLMGQHEMNRVVKLDNGYLTVTCEPFEEELIKNNTDNVIRLKNYLEERGIVFIYAITPNTSCKYDPELPEGIYDYGNENFDRIAMALRRGGVRVIDFRDELYADGIDAYDMMYRTDHHWNTRMGFYAYSKFADILEEELDCEIDPKVRDLSNYKIKTYRKWHLGSRGQRTGRFFGGVDDFDLIIPQFETHLISADGEDEGEYKGLLVKTASLKEKDLNRVMNDLNNRSTYDMVLEDSQGDYINLNSHNDKSILVVSDSFGKAVCPFMDISFQHVRSKEGYLTADFIEEAAPDAVVMFYDFSTSYDPDYFDYQLD